MTVERAEVISGVEHVQALVRQLTDEPQDHETALVLGDWCSHHGFTIWAERLKTNCYNGPDFLPVLAALRTLFGDLNTSGGETGRYTYVAGVGTSDINAEESITFRITTLGDSFKLRRLVIPLNIAEYLRVDQITLEIGRAHV